MAPLTLGAAVPDLAGARAAPRGHATRATARALAMRPPKRDEVGARAGVVRTRRDRRVVRGLGAVEVPPPGLQKVAEVEVRVGVARVRRDRRAVGGLRAVDVLATTRPTTARPTPFYRACSRLRVYTA